MNTEDYQKKIEELEKRIRELEERAVPFLPIRPSYPQMPSPGYPGFYCWCGRNWPHSCTWC